MTRDTLGVAADVSAVVEVNGHSPWSVFCCNVCLQRFGVSALLFNFIGVICCTSAFRQSSQYSSVCFFFSLQQYTVREHAYLSPMSMTMTDHPRQWLKKNNHPHFGPLVTFHMSPIHD